MAREINLVPDIKNEMIKALKLRNLIFFICIIVASASVGVSIIFASSAAIQQASADGKKETIKLLSEKINSYDDLDRFLTIRDQLGNISEISEKKQLLSRIFGVLSVLLPSGPDQIMISEMNVDLSTEMPTISFDAQANAGAEPFIDYNVLDSFKKSMPYISYDYGQYVDRDGNAIPAYCMVESSVDGVTLRDTEKGYYAYWLIEGEGCNPAAEDEEETEEEELPAEENEENSEENSENPENSEEEVEEVIEKIDGYEVEKYGDEYAVKVWRTPQYKEWYKENERPNEPYMNLEGEIKNVPHFESNCMSYWGVEKEIGGKKEIEWTEENLKNSNGTLICSVVPDGEAGISISESSNGRNSDDELVLRFSATITLNSEVFSFNNKHVIANGPSGRFNVTDSFVQVQGMFAQRAEDCAEGDTACEDKKNTGEEK